uniref:Nucleolus and neural progenitor protein-like N-terminal domain-containing protein n=1 Tax=Timema cristinae TaxID=61476 RepID=A0A7R9GVS8_TIMCR|nr:unnamed protein product [Timema cristinae]
MSVLDNINFNHLNKNIESDRRFFSRFKSHFTIANLSKRPVPSAALKRVSSALLKADCVYFRLCFTADTGRLLSPLTRVKVNCQQRFTQGGELTASHHPLHATKQNNLVKCQYNQSKSSNTGPDMAHVSRCNATLISSLRISRHSSTSCWRLDSKSSRFSSSCNKTNDKNNIHKRLFAVGGKLCYRSLSLKKNLLTLAGFEPTKIEFLRQALYPQDHRDIKQLRNTCNQIVFVLNDLKILHDEGAILSRGLYRIKSKQRNDKSFKLVEKVNQGLKRYLGLNLLGVVSNFVPQDPESSDTEAFLPSRQMLEFVLVRIQSFARLFCHVVRCCEQAALYLKMKLSGGHMWTVSLLFFAQIVALKKNIDAIGLGVKAYSRFLVLSSCKWYSSLLAFLQVLPRSPMPWLPPDYELPTDLAQWLDAHWLTETPIAQSGHNRAVNAQKIFDLISLMDEDDSDIELTAFEQLEAIKPEITDEHSLQASVPSLDQSKQFLSKHNAYVFTRGIKLSKILTVNNDGLSNNGGEADPLAIGNIIDGHTNINKTTNQVSKKQMRQNSLPTPRGSMNRHKVTDSADIGVPISRESFVSTPIKKEKPLKSNQFSPSDSKKQKIDSMTTHIELKSFIKMENKFRDTKREISLTSNLDKLQWHMLSKVLKKYVTRLKQIENKKQYKKVMKEAKEIISSAML